MTEPAKFTEDELDKIADGLISSATADSASFRDLIDAAGLELKRRFDEEPSSLPGTFVIKLFLDGQKALAAQDFDPEELESNQVSILDRIDALPREHAAALLKGELARLDSLREGYFAALEKLQEGE